MTLTDVKVSLASEDSNDKILAYVCLTFDHQFVVRDVKIIDSPNGPFIAMPSRKLRVSCPVCRSRVQRQSNFCNRCGKPMPPDPPLQTVDGEVERVFYDIAHPITSEFRQELTSYILEAWQAERIEARHTRNNNGSN